MNKELTEEKIVWKKFSKDLKDLAMEVTNTEKEEMIQLINDEIKYYETRK